MDLYFAGDTGGYEYANLVYLAMQPYNFLESYDIKYRKNTDLVIAGFELNKYFNFILDKSNIIPNLPKLFKLMEEKERIRIYVQVMMDKVLTKIYKEEKIRLIMAYNLLIELYNERGVNPLKLFLVGPEKNNILEEVIDKDENNLLISYDTPNLVQKEINRRKDKMDLYLAGLQSYGNEHQEKIKEAKINNLLFSFDRKNDCSRSIQINNESKLFVDSGAFSAWTRGKTIDVDEYIKFINDRAEYIYLYGQVDFIPGNRVGGVITPEMVREAGEKTWENYLYMRPKMKNPYGLLYTFHVGEPFEFLKRALEWRDENGDAIPYIALGGMVGKPKDTREAFLEKCFKIIKESSNPNVKIHAFGMTDFDLLEKFPITSADSTSWMMTGANGMIRTDYGCLLVSDRQKNDPQHYSHLPLEAQQEVNKEIKEFGFTLEDLKNSRDNRIILNAKYMRKKADNLIQKEYKPKKRLF